MSTPSAEPRGTAALLVNAHGQYLLHLRDANKPHICDPGTWSIPGGNREGDETAREAVARELREETGLTVPLEPFTVVDSHGPDGSTAGRIQVYLGAWDGDADGLPLTEGIMLRWFDARTTAYLTMCPWTQQVIDQHQAQWAGTRTPAMPPAEKPGGRACPNVIGVHLYVEHQGRVLLGLRHPDSPFGASHHHFLAGHCERESAITCLIREAREEAGLRIRAEDVEFAHAVHVVDPPGAGRACNWSSAPTAGRERNESASRTSASAGSGGPPTHCPSPSSRTPGPRSRASAPDASTPRWDGRDADPRLRPKEEPVPRPRVDVVLLAHGDGTRSVAGPGAACAEAVGLQACSAGCGGGGSGGFGLVRPTRAQGPDDEHVDRDDDDGPPGLVRQPDEVDDHADAG